MKKFMAVLTLSLLLSGGAALAHSYEKNGIRIGHIWTRATPGHMTTAAVYVPLLNTGTETDQLTGASTAIAAKAEIHQMTEDNGTMRMGAIDGVTLEPNKPIALHPGGMHIMLFGLKRKLNEGDKFPLTLEFAHAGSVEVEVMVDKAGAMSPSEKSDIYRDPSAPTSGDAMPEGMQHDE